MDGQVKIVDEQTGRIMDGRRWSDGLHQAVEAKEGVKVEAATQTFATITLQNYFRMIITNCPVLTGTAETGSRRTLGHLQIGCSRYPDQPPHCPQRYERPRLQDQTRKNIKPLSKRLRKWWQLDVLSWWVLLPLKSPKC